MLQTEDIYGLSPDAMLGASEDVFHLFLEASTEWQKELKVVPGGLGLPYKKAAMERFDNLVGQDIIKGTKIEKPSKTEITGTSTMAINMIHDLQRSTARSEAMMMETVKN